MTLSNLPPNHLKPATKKWYIHVTNNYELEQHHIRLLTLAAQAWDQAEAARAALAKHGLTFTDANGNPRPRPEVAIARDSMIGFSRLVRELDLDVSAPPAASRPPALRSNRR